jgi:hypothetical protein
MRRAGRDRRSSLPWYGWLGAGILGLGELGVLLGSFPVRVGFYFLAWWSYILLADAWVWRRRGYSLLRTHPREFLLLAFCSAPLWNLFEVLNFRLQNWFYVGVPAPFPYGFVPSMLAYATVLPGIFETYELLRAYDVVGQARTRPWRISRGTLTLSAVIGLGMLIAPLLWPRVAYPLIWGFAVFLGDPICYRFGRPETPCLLRQLERGDPRPLLRLLLAGLICGGLWEFWNAGAVTKWIYTVPGFEEWKWFEMPPLGFLGFPPFAVECYVLTNLLGLARGGRGWEEPLPSGSGLPRIWTVCGTIAALAFNLLAYRGIDRLTVESYLAPIEEIDGAAPGAAAALARLGIRYPQQLLERTAAAERRQELARAAGLPDETLRGLRTAARLADLKGLGVARLNQLARLGVGSVEALAKQDPEELAGRWNSRTGASPPPLPRLRAWVLAARRAPPQTP